METISHDLKKSLRSKLGCPSRFVGLPFSRETFQCVSAISPSFSLCTLLFKSSLSTYTRTSKRNNQIISNIYTHVRTLPLFHWYHEIRTFSQGVTMLLHGWAFCPIWNCCSSWAHAMIAPWSTLHGFVSQVEMVEKLERKWNSPNPKVQN